MAGRRLRTCQQVREYICEEDACHDVGRFLEIYLRNVCWLMWPGHPNRTSCENQSLRMNRLLVANASCVTKRDCRRRRLHRSGCDGAAGRAKVDLDRMQNNPSRQQVRNDRRLGKHAHGNHETIDRRFRISRFECRYRAEVGGSVDSLCVEDDFPFDSCRSSEWLRSGRMK